MAIDYTVRPAWRSDTGAIVALISRSLGQGTIPRDVAYWHWKHTQNPFGESPCLVAESQGQIVGVRAFMRWAWRMNGCVIPAVRAVDTATHPDWRHRGIFANLTQQLVSDMRRDGVALVFNTPNEHSRPGYLKMGWRSLGRTSLWLRPISPVSSRNGRLRRGGAFRPVSEFLADTAACEWLRTLPSEPSRYATPVSTAYLCWRYASAPGFEYFASWAIEGGAGAAAFFREKTHAHARELRICELLVGPTATSRELARQLLHRISSESNAHFASVMAPFGTPEARVLAPCGFIPAPRMGPVLTVRTLADVPAEHPDPLRRGSWGLSIGTLELF
jgi:N-acetylglutamate synthase-like GNAT family acetyltransferase